MLNNGPSVCIRASEAILVSQAVIGSPNFEKNFIVQTNASGHGVSAILSQHKEEEIDHPVAYYSRKLLPQEQNTQKQTRNV